jgi:hypothetical protein
MNTKRTKFVQSPSHKINVTPYYFYNPIALVYCIRRDVSYQLLVLFLCIDYFSLQNVIYLMIILMVRYGLDCSMTFYHSRNNHKLYKIRNIKK